MDKYQKVLGFTIPQGMRYNVFDGPSDDMEPAIIEPMGFDERLFNHMLVLGETSAGKGVFCSTFGLYMHDNYGYNFIDFTDPNGEGENGCYGWPQNDKYMLNDLQKAFPMNEPHGYPFELYMPNWTFSEYPNFTKLFSIGYRDLRPEDFDIFYTGKSAAKDGKLARIIETSESLDSFSSSLIAHFGGEHDFASRALKQLIAMGAIDEETTLDFKALADPAKIHSFWVNDRTICNNQYAVDFYNTLLVRLIYESRTDKHYDPCLFYMREASTIPDAIALILATRGRHNGIHFMVDAQRRTRLLDKTAGFQFSSQAIFYMPLAQAIEVFKETGGFGGISPYDICDQGRGICMLKFHGSKKPRWPFAVSPPVSQYRTGKKDYFELCKDNGTEFISA